jgi:hypothetical protein
MRYTTHPLVAPKRPKSSLEMETDAIQTAANLSTVCNMKFKAYSP